MLGSSPKTLFELFREVCQRSGLADPGSGLLQAATNLEHLKPRDSLLIPSKKELSAIDQQIAGLEKQYNQSDISPPATQQVVAWTNREVDETTINSQSDIAYLLFQYHTFKAIPHTEEGTTHLNQALIWLHRAFHKEHPIIQTVLNRLNLTNFFKNYGESELHKLIDDNKIQPQEFMASVEKQEFHDVSAQVLFHKLFENGFFGDTVQLTSTFTAKTLENYLEACKTNNTACRAIVLKDAREFIDRQTTSGFLQTHNISECLTKSVLLNSQNTMRDLFLFFRDLGFYDLAYTLLRKHFLVNAVFLETSLIENYMRIRLGEIQRILDLFLFNFNAETRTERLAFFADKSIMSAYSSLISYYPFVALYIAKKTYLEGSDGLSQDLLAKCCHAIGLDKQDYSEQLYPHLCGALWRANIHDMLALANFFKEQNVTAAEFYWLARATELDSEDAKRALEELSQDLDGDHAVSFQDGTQTTENLLSGFILAQYENEFSPEKLDRLNCKLLAAHLWYPALKDALPSYSVSLLKSSYNREAYLRLAYVHLRNNQLPAAISCCSTYSRSMRKEHYYSEDTSKKTLEAEVLEIEILLRLIAKMLDLELDEKQLNVLNGILKQKHSSPLPYHVFSISTKKTLCYFLAKIYYKKNNLELATSHFCESVEYGQIPTHEECERYSLGKKEITTLSKHALSDAAKEVLADRAEQIGMPELSLPCLRTPDQMYQLAKRTQGTTRVPFFEKAIQSGLSEITFRDCDDFNLSEHNIAWLINNKKRMTHSVCHTLVCFAWIKILNTTADNEIENVVRKKLKLPPSQQILSLLYNALFNDFNARIALINLFRGHNHPYFALFFMKPSNTDCPIRRTNFLDSTTETQFDKNSVKRFLSEMKITISDETGPAFLTTLYQHLSGALFMSNANDMVALASLFKQNNNRHAYLYWIARATEAGDTNAKAALLTIMSELIQPAEQSDQKTAEDYTRSQLKIDTVTLLNNCVEQLVELTNSATSNESQTTYARRIFMVLTLIRRVFNENIWFENIPKIPEEEKILPYAFGIGFDSKFKAFKQHLENKGVFHYGKTQQHNTPRLVCSNGAEPQADRASVSRTSNKRRLLIGR